MESFWPIKVDLLIDNIRHRFNCETDDEAMLDSTTLFNSVLNSRPYGSGIKAIGIIYKHSIGVYQIINAEGRYILDIKAIK